MNKVLCSRCSHTEQVHDINGCHHKTILGGLKCPVDDAAGWAWSQRYRQRYWHNLCQCGMDHGRSPVWGCPCEGFTTDRNVEALPERTQEDERAAYRRLIAAITADDTP